VPRVRARCCRDRWPCFFRSAPIRTRGASTTIRPCIMAAAVNHPGAVRLLLDAGADPNLRTRIDELRDTTRTCTRMRGTTTSLPCLLPQRREKVRLDSDFSRLSR
jgi:hypothetical protein